MHSSYLYHFNRVDNPHYGSKASEQMYTRNRYFIQLCVFCFLYVTTIALLRNVLVFAILVPPCCMHTCVLSVRSFHCYKGKVVSYQERYANLNQSTVYASWYISH